MQGRSLGTTLKRLRPVYAPSTKLARAPCYYDGSTTRRHAIKRVGLAARRTMRTKGGAKVFKGGLAEGAAVLGHALRMLR